MCLCFGMQVYNLKPYLIKIQVYLTMAQITYYLVKNTIHDKVFKYYIFFCIKNINFTAVNKTEIIPTMYM